MTSYDSTKIYAPVFKAQNAKSFDIYKVKMRSYLAGTASCQALFESGAVVEKDDASLSGKTDVEKKEITDLQALNRKAAGLLLSSIDTETPEGQSAFNLIQKYYAPGNGYSAGDF